MLLARYECLVLRIVLAKIVRIPVFPIYMSHLWSSCSRNLQKTCYNYRPLDSTPRNSDLIGKARSLEIAIFYTKFSRKFPSTAKSGTPYLVGVSIWSGMLDQAPAENLSAQKVVSSSMLA